MKPDLICQKQYALDWRAMQCWPGACIPYRQVLADDWGSGAHCEFGKADSTLPEKVVPRLNIKKSIYLLGWKPQVTPIEFLRKICGFENSMSENKSAGMMEAIKISA